MTHTAQLADFAAGLRFEDIPEPVVRKIEDLQQIQNLSNKWNKFRVRAIILT